MPQYRLQQAVIASIYNTGYSKLSLPQYTIQATASCHCLNIQYRLQQAVIASIHNAGYSKLSLPQYRLQQTVIASIYNTSYSKLSLPQYIIQAPAIIHLSPCQHCVKHTLTAKSASAFTITLTQWHWYNAWYNGESYKDSPPHQPTQGQKPTGPGTQRSLAPLVGTNPMRLTREVTPSSFTPHITHYTNCHYAIVIINTLLT